MLNPCRPLLFATISLTIVLPGTLAADTLAVDDDAGDAAFLFFYDIRPGMSGLFEDGYQRHLAWHHQAGDPWTWSGWTVLIGNQPGRFVNGVFGLRFGEFDHRVDPAGDRADARLHVAPFAKPVARQVLRRRPDLGSGVSWEEQTQAPMLEVTRFAVKPGHRQAFEIALRAWRDTNGASSRGSVTWYELVVGGSEPTYLRIIPRHAWADYGRDPGPRPEVADTVAEIESETWIYRQDLSYIPTEGQ
ncbi:MAG: hypothetical protein AAF657_18880 [Acidobacteriota bacterium]